MNIKKYLMKKLFNWNISWSREKDILNFADYIYSNSHIFLDRKYQEFKKYGFV